MVDLFLRTAGSESHLWLRGEHAFFSALITRAFWKKASAALTLNDLFYCADTSHKGIFELLKMFEKAAAWGRHKGCAKFEFAGSWGMDLSMLAKRLGGKVVSTTYAIDLAE